jgi:hypothetical protein
MQDFTPDGMQVPAAHSKYGDPAMEAMLLALHPIMEKNTGLTLHPTYSYYRVYRSGDELVPHVDRPSCEISTTLCFNFNFENEFNWPIFMDGNAVNLESTDMVIYRGCDLRHWREKLVCGENDWHVQGFFHFVNANGPFAEFKWDQRPSVGAPVTTKQSHTPVVNQTTAKSYIQYTK